MPAPKSSPAMVRQAIEFLHIELASLADGGFSITATATTVDEEEPQLLHQEIMSERAATLDAALEQIQSVVRITM